MTPYELECLRRDNPAAAAEIERLREAVTVAELIEWLRTRRRPWEIALAAAIAGALGEYRADH